ncbi:tape measure protein [Mycobacterium phage Send513]|uniref:Tape measure protein n=1 Tax=Mycobacterium phage Send513 TaxID=1034146 RepID=G1BRK5_9CAUD|nr:tail length tape measure protein [Mycobacterium phage Send513]AEK07473.1 tape measure protein [Mycobacterium phage Send513]
MTSPAGGGAANLGTVTGKVRITYESSNVRSAVKDIEGLQATLSDVGRSAQNAASDVDRAGGVVSQFGRMIDRLGQKVIPNPAEGLGTRVENETTRATKAVANLQKQAGKANVKTSVTVSPTEVRLDRRALENSLEQQQFRRLTLRAPIQLAPSSLELDRRAFERVVEQQRLTPLTLRAPVRVVPTRVDVDQPQGGANNVGGGGSSGIAGVLPMLGRVTAAAAGATAAVAGVGFVLTKGFGRLTAIEDATTKLHAMGVQAKDIERISKASLQSVEGTAFGLEEAFNTAADAINAGIRVGDDLNKYLNATANTASLAGVGMQDLGSAFSQAAIQGKLTGDVLQLLVSRQVPVLKLLAEEYDVTQTKAQEMVSNGEVSFDRFINAMSKTGGAAKAMGNTIGGSWRNLGAAVSRLGANLLAPLFGKQDAGDAGVIATAIQKITSAVDALGKKVKEHQGTIISFFEGVAKVGIATGKVFIGLVTVVSDAVVKITEIVGDLTGWVSQAFAAIADTFGADGVAANARQFADSMHDLGTGIREIRDANIGKVNRAMDQAWATVEKWAAEARAAANANKDLGDSTDRLAPKFVTLKEALEKLEIKAKSAEAALMGTNAQFKEFLEEIEEKGGTQELIDTLTRIREQFVNGGRQIKNYADAIDNLKDSTQSAADRANSLIDALQGLGLLPGGDALSSYNEAFEQMTSYMSNIIDLADTTGDALANMDGTLNLNSKNGRALLENIEKIRREMVQLVVQGEADPDEAYARTVQGLQDLLQRQAGISPDVAQRIIDAYLPKDAILESLKAQNPRDAIESIWEGDPAKIQSELDLLTTTQDILAKIVGPDGKLHVPTVLDTPGTNAGDETNPAPALQGPPHPETGTVAAPDNTPKPPTPEFSGPIPQGPPAGKTVAPESLGGLLGGPDYEALQNQIQNDTEFRKKFLDLASNKEALDKALKDNPEIASQLDELVKRAQAQGQNLSVAFAEGLIEGTPEVRQALLELAGLAGDYLGNSPAKYGPLSGKGWTLFRGKTFTSDWAKGIASEKATAAGVTSDVAGAAADGLSARGATPLNTQIEGLLRDLQAFSDIGKHLLEFGNQISDIAFSVAKFANDMSGGRLFPKSYIKDTTAKQGGSALGPWNPGGSVWAGGARGSGGATGSGSRMAGAGRRGGAPGKLGPNPSQQDIANYIYNKALSEGYTPEQARDFVVQAYGESHLSPTASNPAGWEGIFQFDKPTWQSAGGGNMYDAAQNVDNYFRLARQRGLTPENFTAGSQLGTQVSIGGPWHPENAAKGHLDAALKGAKPFLDAIGSTPTVTPQTTTATKAATPPAAKGGMVDVITPGGPIKAKADIAERMVGNGAWQYASQTATVSKQSGDITPPPGLPAGGSQNTNSALGYLEQIASQFGLKLTSGKRSNAMTASGKSWHLSGEAGDFAIPGVQVPTENKRKFAEYVRDTFAPYIQELIYSDDQGGVNLFQGKPHQYSAGTLSEHRNHVHVAVRNEMLDAFAQAAAPGSIPPAFARDTGQQGTPVTLTGQSAAALRGIWGNTNGLPSMPGKLADLVETDPVLRDAMRNQSQLTSDTVVPVLQHLDGLIADQDKLGTPESKALSEALGGYKSQLQNQFGLQEGPSALDQAQTIASGISSIATDIFGVVDQGLKVVAATQDMANTFVRGIENTKDVNRLIDNAQEWITLFQKGFQTASNITGFAAQIAAMGGADPTGGGSAAQGGLAAASAITGIIAQGLAAVNTAIDIGQEAYGIATKYVGRFIQSWTGLTGSSDVRYLLDEVSGKVQAYSSDNPQNKTEFNTLGRQLGARGYSDRPTVINNNTVYQGPGQDPRDTMDDMMFTIRASGQGAFGYAI